MKVRRTYLLLVTVIGLFSLALYSTYAMFTASVDVGEFVNLTASSLPADTSMLEYERITLNSGDSKIVDLNITNNTTNSLYYGVWYEMVDPSSKTSDITIAKLDTSTSETIGQLSSSTSSKVTLILENFTADIVIINIGVGYSETSSLNLPINRNIVNDVASEGIDASTLPAPTPVNFNYTGAVQEYTIPSTGQYKLEVWGAQGGSYNTTYTGGKGGYSYGTINLNENTKLYVYVGGQATTNTSNRVVVTGGFNGGGNGYNRWYSGTYTYGQGGGGASDIRIDTNSDGSGTLYERVIVAGGGSGSTNRTNGYYGGGTTGGYGTSGYQGTQTSAGTNGSFGTGGSATTSGNNYKYGSAGGGGGWYGGGASSSYSDSTNYDKYSGGGSGYVYTSSTASSCPSGCLLTSTYYLTDAATVGGDQSFTSPTGTTETGHSGNGYARLTPVSTVPSLNGLTTKFLKPGTSYDLLSDVTCVDNGDGCTLLKVSITDTSILAEGEYTVTYIVKDNNNTKYKFTRKLIVTSDLDESGANEPKLVDGLIPVMYDESKSAWVKTSSSNDDSTYKWYNYDNKKWANAVLVTNTNRSTYQNASNGTEIPEEEILAYYVWIPRYKYKVWNITKTVGTDSYNARATGIDIAFENGTATTGTITCNDYSFAAPNSSTPNQTCSGTNGEYYTHPAFTFGDSELEGIWVGKFEVSNSTSQIQTKPNVSSLRNKTVSSFSQAIQNMQASSNVYGLTTDKNKVDSHMLKNMEWGAVAYLTNSNYGRCSGGTCTEVAKNSYDSDTTGCGPQSAGSTSNGSTCNAYTTTLGQTASTTGNVYGIYDMSGGAGEYVMGNMSSGSGSYTYNARSAGSNFSYSTETAKYLDAYAYGTSYSDQTAYNRARLGDATGENVLTASIRGGWYGNSASIVESSSSWFIRGCDCYDTYAGVFCSSRNNGGAASFFSARATLIAF